MKTLIKWLCAYVILVILWLVGIIGFSATWVFIWIPLIVLAVAIILVVYGFFLEKMDAEKTRRFWRSYYNERDELGLYEEDEV